MDNFDKKMLTSVRPILTQAVDVLETYLKEDEIMKLLPLDEHRRVIIEAEQMLDLYTDIDMIQEAAQVASLLARLEKSLEEKVNPTEKK
jgi:hypothetical protein